MTLLLIAAVLNLAHATRNPFDWGSKNPKNIPCLPGKSSNPQRVSLYRYLSSFLSLSLCLSPGNKCTISYVRLVNQKELWEVIL